MNFVGNPPFELIGLSFRNLRATLALLKLELSINSGRNNIDVVFIGRPIGNNGFVLVIDEELELLSEVL